MQNRFSLALLFITFLINYTSFAQEQDTIKNNFPPLSEITIDKCNVIYINGYKYLQRDFTKTLDSFYHADPGDTSEEAIEHRRKLESYAKPNPSVETLKIYFSDAAKEFQVPIYLLEAIGQVESNWTQAVGPTIDQGWGIMHLVQNTDCHTLDEAAALLKVSQQVLKDDAKQNIRGAAALLAKYAGSKRKNFSAYEEWAPALKKISGLSSDYTQTLSLKAYLNVLYKGCDSLTLWGERVKINPQPKKNK